MDPITPTPDRVVFDLSEDAIRRERQVGRIRLALKAGIGVLVFLLALNAVFVDWGDPTAAIFFVAVVGAALVFPVGGLWLIDHGPFPHSLVIDGAGLIWGLRDGTGVHVRWGLWEGWIEVFPRSAPTYGADLGSHSFRALVRMGERLTPLSGRFSFDQALALLAAARAHAVAVTEPQRTGWLARGLPITIGAPLLR